jgi:PPOX class probable F420-dependent enzyme
VEEARGDAGLNRVVERVVDAQNRFYERVRDSSAWSLTASAPDFEHLRGHKYAVLVTFRRSGETVPTAVWFGLDGGKLYVRTERRSGKVKRIRNDARVLVAPSGFRANPLGPAAGGTARILEPAESEHAERALAAHYGLFRRLYEGVGEQLNADMVYLEVTPA